MVIRPLLRAGFFALWAGFMAWAAFDSAHSYIRWPMAVFAAVALAIGVRLLGVAVRQRAG